ncbi:srr1-like protein, partial [Nannochloropsis gaditana CCMP526]|uniref:srr1-like protein n=1 Tax=Nannochloropsis gaditana (strain CCMP526) TaxID=1093141 RepID=UPI00029F68FB
LLLLPPHPWPASRRATRPCPRSPGEGHLSHPGQEGKHAIGRVQVLLQRPRPLLVALQTIPHHHHVLQRFRRPVCPQQIAIQATVAAWHEEESGDSRGPFAFLVVRDNAPAKTIEKVAVYIVEDWIEHLSLHQGQCK